MIEERESGATRDPGCVRCGRVDSPIRVGPGPGWLAILLWASAAALWTAGMALQRVWVGYLAAPVFLGALIYTLWYFYRREKACRHCGARWMTAGTTAGHHRTG
jgi:4-hydroxybenzoate polyprenyltransferase